MVFCLCLGEYTGQKTVKSFLRYAKARRKDHEQQKLRDYYLAEGLRILVSNTAHAFGGSTITKSLTELSKPQKIETRTADDIKRTISAKLQRLGEQ